VSQREDDLRVLNELLTQHADELSDRETEGFASMRFDLTAYWIPGSSTRPSVPQYEHLIAKQREWVQLVYERICGKPLTRLTAGAIPRGREVPTPAVLQNLPKQPPPRKRDE